jgi:adenosylcobinamide kinase / adenosylcobinamide-phosphate guanylyltransferase
MRKIIFITGGARSGKSSFAEQLLSLSDRVLYVATAQPFDAEMRHRIALHTHRRNKKWETIEQYKDMRLHLAEKIQDKEYLLIDCLTVMVSNLLLEDRACIWEQLDMKILAEKEAYIQEQVAQIFTGTASFRGSLVLVSNELGMGVVPPSALGRHFRDIAGRINQFVAAQADEVYFMVSGIPMKIKG